MWYFRCYLAHIIVVADAYLLLQATPVNRLLGCEDALHESCHAVFSIFTLFVWDHKSHLSINAFDCDQSESLSHFLLYLTCVLYDTAFGSYLSSRCLVPRSYWDRTYLLSEAALIENFAFTHCGIKGDIISLYWNEFDSVSSLVAQSKQTQQAFGLAYWCPVGVGLWAKMKICTVWFRGKMSSALPLFPPAPRFFQRSVFIPCSLVSPCFPSPGFWEERAGDRYGDLWRAHVDLCGCVWEYVHA